MGTKIQQEASTSLFHLCSLTWKSSWDYPHVPQSVRKTEQVVSSVLYFAILCSFPKSLVYLVRKKQERKWSWDLPAQREDHLPGSPLFMKGKNNACGTRVKMPLPTPPRPKGRMATCDQAQSGIQKHLRRHSACVRLPVTSRVSMNVCSQH